MSMDKTKKLKLKLTYNLNEKKIAAHESRD
jgi:hypothetical protein